MLNLFQVLSFVVSFISFATIILPDSFVGGPVGRIGSVKESHGSSHTYVDWPLPIFFPSFLFSSSFPIMIIRHPCEEELGALLSIKDDVWQYLPLRILVNKESEC